MRALLLVTLLTGASAAQASWFRQFCERWLIQDDPQPYAEESVTSLIQLFEFQQAQSPSIDSRRVRREMEFRLHSEGTSFREKVALRRALEGK